MDFSIGTANEYHKHKTDNIKQGICHIDLHLHVKEAKSSSLSGRLSENELETEIRQSQLKTNLTITLQDFEPIQVVKAQGFLVMEFLKDTENPPKKLWHEQFFTPKRYPTKTDNDKKGGKRRNISIFCDSTVDRSPSSVTSETDSKCASWDSKVCFRVPLSVILSD